MELRYLEQSEKERSRELYELCFPEDSETFIDYYYAEKCRDNQILVLQEQDELVSMVHLNPFQICMYGQEATVHYLVAVATAEEYRRRGYAVELMRQAFHDLYQAEEPFIFLMPANPDYYYSSGFEYWENQIELKQDQDTIWRDGLQIAAAKEKDCQELAEYSNRVLAEQFDLFVKKDEAYYRRLLKEQHSEDGQVVVIRQRTAETTKTAEMAESAKAAETTEAAGKICGIFCFDRECGVEIREPVMEDSCSEYIHPLMMGRILNLERFCGMMKSTGKIFLETEIRDTMIPENNGRFRIQIDENGGRAVRVHGLKTEQSMDIAEFGKMIFDNMRIYINEVV